jgi:hypothetical protein
MAAGFRSLFYAVLLFGIISNTNGASLKGYDPYGSNKRINATTTAPPTPFEQSSYENSTTNAVGQMVKDDNTEEPQLQMIRQCTCAESDVCIKQAWSQISSCQETCKSKLYFFGDDTDALLKCFDNDSNGGTLINNCFHTMKGYCALTTSSSSTPQYIEKPTYEPKVDNGLKLKEHEIVEAFKAFHICAGKCMKDLIVECFEQKECGVSLGDSQDIGKIGEFCATLKGSIYTTSVKALPCLMPGLKRRGSDKH